MPAIESMTGQFGTTIRSRDQEKLRDLDIDQVLHLCRSRGALHFVGFNADLAEFEEFGNRICSDWMSYQGGAYAKQILNPQTGSDIYSVNLYGAHGKQIPFKLAMHADMSYLKNRPVFLFIYCIRRAATGGETLICDGKAVYQHLSSSVRDLFERQQITYTRTYPDGNWQSRFQTESLQEARQFCKENDLAFEVDQETRTVKTEYRTSATSTSRWGNEPVFCNSLLQFLWLESVGKTHSLVRMDDGSPIPQSVVEELTSLTEEFAIPVLLEERDFLWVDNTRALHGRRPFQDVNRNIAQRLARSTTW